MITQRPTVKMTVEPTSEPELTPYCYMHLRGGLEGNGDKPFLVTAWLGSNATRLPPRPHSYLNTENRQRPKPRTLRVLGPSISNQQ